MLATGRAKQSADDEPGLPGADDDRLDRPPPAVAHDVTLSNSSSGAPAHHDSKPRGRRGSRLRGAFGGPSFIALRAHCECDASGPEGGRMGGRRWTTSPSPSWRWSAVSPLAWPSDSWVA